MRLGRKLDARGAAWIGTATALLACLALALVSELFVHARLDLTRTREFTLSSAAIHTLETLPGRVTARVVMSRDLPLEFRRHRQRALDLLREFEARSDGRFVLLQEDPGRDSLRRRTALALGVEEVRLQAHGPDGTQAKKGFFGLVLVHGESKEVFPVLRNLETLEYDLIVRLSRLAGTRRTIGVIEGGAGARFSFQQPGLPAREGFAANFPTVFAEMQALHDVVTPDLDREPVPKNLSLLLVAAPRRLTEREAFRVDQFVMSGGAVLFLTPGMAVDLAGEVRAVPADNGYAQLLEHYGLAVRPDLVLEPRRHERVRLDDDPLPKPYPYWVVTGYESLDAGNPVTAALPGLSFPWVSSVAPDSAAQPGTRLTVLARSSGESWSVSGPQDIFPRPLEDYRPTDTGARVLAALRTGTFTSRDAHGAPAGVTPEERRALRAASPADARVLVVANALFATDFYAGYADAPGNMPFLLNALDHLALGPDLIHVRSRVLPAAMLDETRVRRFGTSVRIAGFTLVPALLLAFGLAARARRERRERRERGDAA